ncbi:FG-GAP-like repeat-containing protein [Verrucomicrobiota bacterium]
MTSSRFRLLWLLVAIGTVSLPGGATADIQSYDSGVLGSSISGLWGGAVRFTSPYATNYMNVDAVRVRGHSAITGTIDVKLWASNGGSPSNELGSLNSQFLSSTTWNVYDVSGLGIRVAPGEDVFGGIRTVTAQLPYDNNDTTVDRSWYKMSSGSSWTQGKFGAGDQDLMVRLEYSKGDFFRRLLVSNDDGATGVTTNFATLHGSAVDTAGSNAYVRIYWGPTDGGTNAAAWTNTPLEFGILSSGAFSTNLVGLTNQTVFYYRCWASNDLGVAWAPSSTVFATGPLNLVVRGDPSQLGLSSPYGYGTNILVGSATVTNTVTSPAGETNGQRTACLSWRGDGLDPSSGVGSTAIFSVVTNSTLTWEWTLQYFLDVSSGTNGSTDTGDGWYTNGAIVAIAAVASNGYGFAGWSGDVPPANTNDNPLTLTMDQQRSLTCHWAKMYWLDVTAGAHGSVDVGDGWYSKGSNVTLTAAPDPVYYFVGWSGDVPAPNTNDNPLTLTMDQSRTVTASFVLPRYQVVVSNQYAATFLGTGPQQFGKHAVDTFFDQPSSVYAADMDGDGDMDVLGAAWRADDITWWENTDGSGTNWAEHTVDGAFDSASSVYAADMDGDGDMDVLGAASAADDIAWWENLDGKGTNWLEHTVDGSFDQPSSVYAADMDGDGDMDVLGAASAADDVAWWENLDGKGTNWIKRTVDGGFDGAFSVWAGDMDGDGDLDVLGAAYMGDDITWWENLDGVGSLWDEHSVDGDFDAARSAYAVDMDGDSDLDVLGAASGANDITWWENLDGNGTSWSEHTVDGDAALAYSAHAVDLDGDGDMDVLGAAMAAAEITWWENTDRTGTSWAEHTVDAAFDGARSVYAADIDGDGDMDVLGAANSADDITWWENDQQLRASFNLPSATNTLDAATNLVAYLTNAIAWGNSSTQVICAGWVRTGSDPGSGSGSNAGRFALTNDTVIVFNWSTQYWLEVEAGAHGGVDVENGWHSKGSNVTLTAAPDPACYFVGWSGDVPAPNTNDNPLTLAMDQPRTVTANFILPQYEVVVSNQYATTFIRSAPRDFSRHTVDGDFDGAGSVYAADVDGDGDMDVLGAAGDADDIAWWENTDGTGTNWAEHTVDGAFNSARSVYAADVDGDGDMDVLGAAYYAADITWWENTDGTGTNWTEHTVDGTFDGARSAYAADVDGDGDMDVLGAAYNADDITWWENTDGTGTNWTEHTVDGIFDGANSAYAADVDGDGDMDVLGAASYADDIAWWENTDGTGTNWAEHTVDGAFDGANSVYAADVDGDGDMDVLGAAGDADDITWWENTDGTGTSWAEHTVDGAFDGPRSVYAADVDGDGDMDVLGAAYWADDITWWENTDGTGTSWVEHTVDGAFDGAYSVCAADVDGDGHMDVLGAAAADDSITWWENDSELLGTFYAPSWTNSVDASMNLIVYLTNSVAWDNGQTQVVCAGWVRTGSDPGSGTNLNTGFFALTNDATLVFSWTTNVMFQHAANEGGYITGSTTGWYQLGSAVVVTGVPLAYCTWSNWTGSIETTVNPLTLTNDQAHAIWANFAAELATNATPKWWLVQHGWTNAFDTWATNDTDEDGLFTWQEYVSDTDPTNHSSALQIIHVSVEPSGFRVDWKGGEQSIQYIECRENLATTSDVWNAIYTNTPPTSITNFMTDAAATNDNRFYRIKARRP